MDIHVQKPRPPQASSFAHALVDVLWQLGIRHAYGVCGREIGAMWSALLQTSGGPREIVTRHARHENGAGYAAYGCWSVTERPVVVYTTTGPGVANVITSLETARVAGAQVILVSAATAPSERGRLGIQDTSSRGFHLTELYREGALFDVAETLDRPQQLDKLIGRLAAGIAKPTGFLAHLAISTSLQIDQTGEIPIVPRGRYVPPALASHDVERLAALLDAPFSICVGWGARRHATAIHRLLDLTGAPVVCSPRALGIVDAHPQFLGVIGNGGREETLDALTTRGLERMLVLGSGLGEATTGWDARIAPPSGFVHVDLDARVFAKAYPKTRTVAFEADIGTVLTALLARPERLVRRSFVPDSRSFAPPQPTPVSNAGSIHPARLMDVIQRVVVDGTELPILADASSAMFWGARYLRFAQPGRWIVENRFGAVGAAAGAVVGAADGRRGAAVAIVGDGAMHMQDEISTAVHYGIPAVWVVLNDSGMGIVRYGMMRNGWKPHDADFPLTDFAAVARAKGAAGVHVTREEDLEGALCVALAHDAPTVVDIVIDRDAVAPIGARASRA